MPRNARTSTTSATIAQTKRYTSCARSSRSIVRENEAPSDGAARQRHDAANAERRRRHIQQLARPSPRENASRPARFRPRVPHLGKHEHEVQEQRREQRHRDRIAPVEHPVEPIERAVERERERAEERDAQPEEMQRRLIARTPHAHGRADEQREEAHAREHEIHRARLRRRRERHLERLRATRAAAADTRGASLRGRPMMVRDDVGGRSHRRRRSRLRGRRPVECPRRHPRSLGRPRRP